MSGEMVAHTPDAVARVALWAGVVGPPLFVATFLIEGATRRGYDPVRLQVSYLSLGDQGWIQIANFCVSGGLGDLLCLGPPSGAPVRPRHTGGTAADCGLWPRLDRFRRVRNRSGFWLSARDAQRCREGPHAPRPAPRDSRDAAHVRLSNSCQPRVCVAFLGRSHDEDVGNLFARYPGVVPGSSILHRRHVHGPLPADLNHRVRGLVGGDCSTLSQRDRPIA